tara:strand:- start:1962 stop:2582 length:621 start_codon:yes stop_codon:yes gene_type:complete
MFKAFKRIDGLKAVVVSQWVFIVVLALVIGMTCFGWSQAVKTERVYMPPNPTAGGYIQKNSPFIGNVYNFAFNIFTAINTWNTSGEKDYINNILSLKNYLGHNFESQLVADYHEKEVNGALMRKRTMTGVPGKGFTPQKVESLGNGSWVVYIDIHLEESVDGSTIKNVYMRYPLLVQQSQQSILDNPFGLVIAGYYKQPIRTKTIK